MKLSKKIATDFGSIDQINQYLLIWPLGTGAEFPSWTPPLLCQPVAKDFWKWGRSWQSKLPWTSRWQRSWRSDYWTVLLSPGQFLWRWCYFGKIYQLNSNTPWQMGNSGRGDLRFLLCSSYTGHNYMIQAAYFSFLECLLYLAYPLEVAKRRPCALVGKSSSTAICRLGALSYAQL